MSKSPSPHALREHVRAHASDYLADPNVTSVGVGHKVVDGRRTDEVCLQFTVRQKVDLADLEALGSAPIPEAVEVRSQQVRTDVLERSYGPSFRVVPEKAPDERRTKVDPVSPGVSVGGWATSAGTLGAIVHDRRTGEALALSNWHVLHGPDAEVGDAVHQPGPYDDNRVEGTRMGVLRRSYLGVAGDCAVSSIEGRRVEEVPVGLEVAPTELGDAELDDKVVKSGRTTGVTYGVVSRVDVVAKIPYDGVGEQEVGCLEISPDPNNEAEGGRISDGGDSGAVWLFRGGNHRTTSTMAGLHFAGDAPEQDGSEHALACLPASVFDKLEISLSAEAAQQEAADRAAGSGFDTTFLATEIPLPTLTGDAAGDAAPLLAQGDGDGDGDAGDCHCPCADRRPEAVRAAAARGAKDGSDSVAHHTHFSLVLSRTRRLARWVAWNVDGGAVKRLSRDGERFGYDPLYAEEAQVGEEMYRDNDLDRGHVARRAELCWGPEAEARRANSDSFFFTNITPQMNDFNQSARHGVWGELENAVFDGAQVDRLRVSILGGPVLGEDDPAYRGVQVPREFWKVIAYEVDGDLRVKGFLLTQQLDRLQDIDLREFATYEVPLDDLTERTGVAFGESLTGASPQGVGARRITRASQVDW